MVHFGDEWAAYHKYLKVRTGEEVEGMDGKYVQINAKQGHKGG